jgi:hypothetical protein
LPRAVSHSHGETVLELTTDFHGAVDHYLEDCAKTGLDPQKPAPGKLMLRIRPEVHAADHSNQQHRSDQRQRMNNRLQEGWIGGQEFIVIETGKSFDIGVEQVVSKDTNTG